MPRAGATVINRLSTLIGEVKDYSGDNAPDGWLQCDGSTVGNASSGATGRANADTRSLFVHLWTNFANAQLVVSGGRGASALADFDANKTITLPDLRGRTIAGKDNMGGTAANRLTSAGSGVNGTTLGTAGGAETHTLTESQLASHSHTQWAHNHSSGLGADNPGISRYGVELIDTKSLYWDNGGGPGNYSYSYRTSDRIAMNQNTGSGSTHQNTQPTYILTKIIKY